MLEIKRASLFEDIDPSNKSNFLPINQIYLGAKVHEISNTPKYITNQEILMGVKVRCRDFLITICSEIKYRFSGTEQLMKLCSVFSIENFLNQKTRSLYPSIGDIVNYFPGLFNGCIYSLDIEWRRVDFYSFSSEIKKNK